MGGLLAFRVGNYDNTAEREQFRFLCQQLKAHFKDSGEFCVFVGNYNIGCELDALFIKKDAIISIEFKNYGGNVVASENGEWTADGVTIKGGSRKTVLQQARINHTIVKRELKALGVENKQIKDVPHLVVFHQPIYLDNRLSATNRSWLHITDDNHFVEKLDDITCPKTDFDPLDIVNLAELLNLNSYYLKEFSNASYESQVQKNVEIEVFEGIKNDAKLLSKIVPVETVETGQVEESVSDFSQQNEKVKVSNSRLNQDLRTELNVSHSNPDFKSLEENTRQIINVVFGPNNIEVFALNPNDFGRVYPSFRKHIRHEFVVVLKGQITIAQEEHLRKFLQKKLIRISNSVLFWQTGEYIESQTKETLDEKSSKEEYAEYPPNNNHTSKNLPDWLDKFLFSDLGAQYSPDHSRFEYNLDLNKDEIKVYLGTYFPRSYVEIDTIFRELYLNSNYAFLVSRRSSVSILDLGCGTGGDVFGLLSFLENSEPSLASVRLLVIDGNQIALRFFEKIMAEYRKHSRLHIDYRIGPAFIENEDDLNLLSDVVSDKYDLILSCKAICEMLAKKRIENKAYKQTASILSKKLTDDGIMLIEDVTIKSPATEKFIPYMLNAELNEFVSENTDFATIYPTVCKGKESKCNEGCFFNKKIKVSHSAKENDISKIIYRIIGKKAFAEKIIVSPSSKSESYSCNIK